VVGKTRNDINALSSRMERNEKAVEALGAQCATLSEALAALRTLLEEATPAPSTTGGAGDDARTGQTQEHQRLLRAAAQVSRVQLICHRDTWEFLSGRAGRHAHFRMPAHLADHGKGRFAAALSGRSLIAVLISLDEIRHSTPGGDDADQAMASTAYERISAALRPVGRMCPTGEIVTITLDDRTPADETATEAARRSAG
jgi:hypothetical protein